MENWYFPRTDLAQKYLGILKVGISSNLAIIAPRRKGKTLFVLQDISSLAHQEKYLPVYASLWQNINAPHEGLILAVEEALDTLSKRAPIKRLLNSKIKKTALSNELLGKLEVEFADAPKKPSNKELLLLEQLLTKLQKKSKGRTILLLIDEIQHLATSPQFAPLTHALRTMLDKRQGEVKAIFTGSSRHYMNLLFNESQSPFYQFVETVPFFELGIDFMVFLSEKLAKDHKIFVDSKKLLRAFRMIDQSPYWMMKIISHMVTFSQDLKASLNYVLQLLEAAEGFDVILGKLKPIDKIVYLALSEGKSPFAKSLLAKIDKKTSVKGIYPNVQRSIKRLIDMHLVSQIEQGEYNIEKPGFKRFLEKEGGLT